VVLRSGGLLGGAFHAGAVKALLDCRGIDAREVTTIVGTSAGSITGAMLGAGLRPNDVYRRETNQPLSPAGQRLLGKARRVIGARTEQRSSIGLPAAPHIALQALLSPFRAAPGSVASGMLPRGQVSTDRISELIDAMIADRPEGSWAWKDEPYIKVCAVDMSTGRRKLFDGSDGETLGQAVAASCAVPGVFRPVTINEVEYFDGGVHSPDNVDVLRNEV
jgi:NTE family protein